MKQAEKGDGVCGGQITPYLYENKLCYMELLKTVSEYDVQNP